MLHSNNSNLSSPNNSQPSTPDVGPVGSTANPFGSSHTLPLPLPPRQPVAGIERSPTVPPRPPLRSKDSYEINKGNLNTDGGHRNFKNIKKQGAHHQHQHKTFAPPKKEDVYLDEDDIIDDAEDEHGYLREDLLNPVLPSADDDENDGGEKKLKKKEESVEGQDFYGEEEDGYLSFDQVRQYRICPTDEDDDNQGHLSDDGMLDEEDPYVEFVGEKAILNRQFTKMGGIAKELSVHLRLAPQSLSTDATLSLSMVWSALPSLPGDADHVILSPVVSCTSFTNNLELLKPLSLEIQHCGVVKELSQTKPKLWCMRKIPG